MCPDRDLISAYVDGEVPSPWRERLEEHLASCADCAAVVDGYRELGERLRAAPVGIAPAASRLASAGADVAAAEAAAVERGRERLEGMLLAAADRVADSARFPPRAVARSHVSQRRVRLGRRSLKMSFPLAAAAALFAVLLGGAGALVAFRPARGASVPAVATSELVSPQAQNASMEDLLRYLDSRDGQVTLTIKLPSGTTFSSPGKPVIMRESKALPGTTVGNAAP